LKKPHTIFEDMDDHIFKSYRKEYRVKKIFRKTIAICTKCLRFKPTSQFITNAHTYVCYFYIDTPKMRIVADVVCNLRYKHRFSTCCTCLYTQAAIGGNNTEIGRSTFAGRGSWPLCASRSSPSPIMAQADKKAMSRSRLPATLTC
jgi:hypothetical protein